MGTDFSGLGSFELAATRVAAVLGRTVDICFSCDTDPHCQQMLLENHCPLTFFPDITQRDNTKAAAVDSYGAGFPCQPFSSAGLGMGIHDLRQRGLLVADSLAYVEAKKPSLVIYENVTGILQKKHAELLQWVLTSLKDMQYKVHMTTLDTEDFGVPHHRPRVYIVCIKTSCLRRSFAWPAPVACVPLDEFLGGHDKAPGYLLVV